MGRAIFLSYRRDDSEGEAGRLFDDLVRAFGENSVFMDVTGINPGIDFRKVIDDNVATCGVLLAVMGPRWATITGSSGQRRLDDDNDFVRLEIASALARNIAVIPVLVHDAKMPHPDELPDNLKDLAYRNSVEITHARWNSDVQLLTRALGQYVTSSSATDTEPVHATVAVQLPPPNAPTAGPVPTKSSRAPLIAGIAIAAVVLIAIAAFFSLRGPGHPQPVLSTPIENAAQPAASPAAAVTSASSSPITGTWTNPSSPKGDTLVKLDISGTGNELSIHAWGACPNCDWGSQPATFDGTKATATWNFSQSMGSEAAGRVATVTVVPGGNKLDVTVANTFSNRPPNQRRTVFVRAQ